MLRARILLSTSNPLVEHNVAQLARHSSATVAREPLQLRSLSLYWNQHLVGVRGRTQTLTGCH